MIIHDGLLSTRVQDIEVVVIPLVSRTGKAPLLLMATTARMHRGKPADEARHVLGRAFKPFCCLSLSVCIVSVDGKYHYHAATAPDLTDTKENTLQQLRTGKEAL